MCLKRKGEYTTETFFFNFFARLNEYPDSFDAVLTYFKARLLLVLCNQNLYAPCGLPPAVEHAEDAKEKALRKIAPG